MVAEIIRKEDKALSDQKITDILILEDIRISRRTVTKYRKALKILCARDRNRMK
jgi:RNA polymerase, sigma 54 subunit, RpoN/SigL